MELQSRVSLEIKPSQSMKGRWLSILNRQWSYSRMLSKAPTRPRNGHPEKMSGEQEMGLWYERQLK